MRIFFDDHLVAERLELWHERDGGGVSDERVCFAEKSELGMVFGSDRLNMNNLSISRAKSVQ